MKEFGGVCSFDPDSKIIVAKGIPYEYGEKSESKFQEYMVESDASTAAYDIAISAIYGYSIILNNLTINCKQGELEFLSILQKHLKEFEFEEDESSIKVRGTHVDRLYEIDTNEINMLDASDSFMALAVVLAIKLPKGTEVS